MLSEWELQLQKVGIDADLDMCVRYQYEKLIFTVEDIDRVLALYEGDNDTAFRWIIQLKDKRFVFLYAKRSEWDDWDSDEAEAISRFGDSPHTCCLFALCPASQLRQYKLATETKHFERLKKPGALVHVYAYLLWQIESDKKAPSEWDRKLKSGEAKKNV
jgi:hypothetical protein